MIDRQHIVIVGGGFSGTALAVHLLRLGHAKLDVTLIEASSSIGRGIAYGTCLDDHVLNTRACQMSLLPDAPGHFVDWLGRRGIPAAQFAFVPRRLFGEYVEETLRQVIDETETSAGTFSLRTSERVTGVTRGTSGFRVELASGGELEADSVVLALGNSRPSDPLGGMLGPGPRYIRDPWRHDLLAEVAPTDNVLVLGTGLTMIDTVLTLRARGHSGNIEALSRNGLLPRPHAYVPQTLPIDLRNRLLTRVLTQTRLTRLTRELRATLAEAEARGYSWHAVIDAMRPHVPELWRALDDRERRRFLARLRPFWEVHRHRVPPKPNALIEQLRDSGRLSVRAGRIVDAVEHESSIEVVREWRGTRSTSRDFFDWVVNCTGPTYREPSRSPLETQLVEHGFLRFDKLCLGYLTTPDGAAIGRDGIVPGLYVIGPACRPLDWETTAVPELTDRAEALAARLVADWNASRPPRTLRMRA